MFCTNCGEKLDDDAVFCTQCGTRVIPEEASAPVQEQPQASTLDQEAAAPQAQVPSPTSDFAKKIGDTFKKWIQLAKDNKKTTGIIAGAVVIIAAVSIFLATRPTTVKLDKYISVEYSGYNTVGNASTRFDADAFRHDYAGKIKYEGGNKMFASLSDEDICSLLLDLHISGKLDKTSGLSNGDSITYQWKCDAEKAKKDFDVKLSCKDLTFSVEGLKEPESVDPFAELELSYSGFSPNAEVHLKNNSTAPYKYNLNFNIQPSEKLKNGDTITVSLPYLEDEDGKKAFLERYGVAFTQTSKTYTVEGLKAYVQALSEVNEDILEQMKTHSSDVINAHIAKSWDSNCSLKDISYLGSYLLTPKSFSNYIIQNRIYLVYQVNAVVSVPDEEIEENVSYYFTVCFENMIANSDGTVSVDLGQYRMPDSQFIKKIGESTYSFRGFETLDDAFKQCVTAYADRYNNESNVEAP